MPYRLHVDIPLGDSLEEAKLLTEAIVEEMHRHFKGVELVQYRLANDSDRSIKNYMDINENGHCSSKKSKIEFWPSSS